MAIENFSRQDKMLFNPTLNLRRDTTPDQVRTILSKLGVQDRTHAAMIGLKRGIIEL